MGRCIVAECEWGEFLMADYLVTDTELTAVADAIREKGDTSAVLEWPNGYVSAVEDIETGGGVETASVVVCKEAGYGYGRVYYTDENMEPQNAYGIVRASMPIGSIVVANDSVPAEPGPTAQRAGITQLFAYPSRSSVIYAFKVTG